MDPSLGDPIRAFYLKYPNYITVDTSQMKTIVENLYEGTFTTELNYFRVIFPEKDEITVYNFELYCFFSSNCQVGDTCTINTSLEMNDVEIDSSEVETVTLLGDTPTISGEITVDVPSFSLPGEDYQSCICFGATTTLTLSNFQLSYEPPSQVNLSSCEVKWDSEMVESYSIYGITASNPLEELLILGNTCGSSGNIDLSSCVMEDDRLTCLILRYDNSVEAVAQEDACLWVKGSVEKDCEFGSIITSICNLSGQTALDSFDKTVVTNTLVEETSRLELEAEFVNPPTFCQPGDKLTGKFTIPSHSDVVRNPVFLCLLPSSFDAVDNIYFLYHQDYSEKIYDTREENFPLSYPIIEILDDYQQIGMTLLRCTWDETLISYRESLEMYCDFLVSESAVDSVTLSCILGNAGDNTLVTGETYLDEYDLDGDSLTNEYLVKSNEIISYVASMTEFSINMLVKGDLNSDFFISGIATAGGEGLYSLTFSNTQSEDMNSVEIVDILPFVGDRQVLVPSISRGSQYNIFPTGEIMAEIRDISTKELVEGSQLKVEYSTSHDPIRFDASGTGTLGTGTWSDTPPSNITLLASVKISTKEEAVLAPNQEIYVTIPVKTPVGAPVGELAYNSAAVLVSLSENSQTPQESANISLQIASSDKAVVGQFVWNDENGDGIFSPGEEGINGVLVSLYDKKGTLLSKTCTCDHMNGEPGYYQFHSLEAGEYQVGFTPNPGESLTLQNLTSELGSRADPETGLTPLFFLTEGEYNLLQNAGICVDEHDFSREQAITDVIESVALQQTALASILDAEGAKIQKAVSLNLGNAELLSINASVQTMVEAITALELVLKKKVAVVTGQSF